MEDSENAVPPSKKRAGREISKDDPESEEDEDSDLQTFKRASEEVLATRRIVKVRRTKTTPVSSNPFSGICLIPSGNSGLDAPETTEIKDISKGEEGFKGIIDAGEETAENTISNTEELRNKKTNPSEESFPIKKDDSSEEKGKLDTGDEARESNTKVDESRDNCEHKTNEIKDCVEKATDDVKEETVGGKENEDGKSEDKEDGKDSVHGEASLSSFNQHSSTPNAFTGFSGSGFSMSTFSFPSLTKNTTAFGNSSGTMFGSKTDQTFGQGLATNGSSSLFNIGTSSTGGKVEGSGVTSMQEIPVETGEENEKVAFSTDAVLFEFLDGTWKERGKGELKLNVSSSGNERARLLMRARGNFRLILNSNLYPDMKLTNMDKRGITFACVNGVADAKDGLSTFALKFKDGSIVEEFRAIVMTQLPKASADDADNNEAQ